MNKQLWELQDADNTLARLRRELSKLDDGASTRAARDTLQRAFDEEQTHLSGLNEDRRAREDDLKSIEDKIARQQSRLMTATSSHEISALERDIKGLNARRGELDEAILELMESISNSEARACELVSQLKTAREETAQIEDVFARESARLNAEMKIAHAARETSAAQLPADEKQKYDEVAARHGGVAIAKNEGGNCSACGNALTPFNLKEARTQDFPTCENCGRLLFLA